MGRTLHWTIKRTDGHPLSIGHFTAIDEIGQHFANAVHWTCETLSLSLTVLPQWSRFEKGEGGVDHAWSTIKTKYDTIVKTGVPPMMAYHRLVEEGYCRYISTNDTMPAVLNGFCKTAENDFNAFVVTVAMFKISMAFPELVITLYDEGRLLECPIIIQNNRARPDTKTIQCTIGYQLASGLFSPHVRQIDMQVNTDWCEEARRLWEIDQNYRDYNTNHWGIEQCIRSDCNFFCDYGDVLETPPVIQKKFWKLYPNLRKIADSVFSGEEGPYSSE